MTWSSLNRTGLVFSLGASVALAACGTKDNTATTDTSAAAPAMPAGATADSMAGRTDSAAKMGAGTNTNAPMTDPKIMSALTATNAGEVAVAKLAEQKATDPDVKSFARMMVSDHEAMLKKGGELGKQLNIVPAAGEKAEDVTDQANDIKKDLEGKTGKDFDKAYVDKMVDAHQNALNLLNTASTSANNAELKTMLTTAIPKVQAHLDRAKQLQAKLNK